MMHVLNAGRQGLPRGRPPLDGPLQGGQLSKGLMFQLVCLLVGLALPGTFLQNIRFQDSGF